MNNIKWAVLDTMTVAKRNLIKYTRSPQLIIFATIQPVMFLLLFNYVFGGAIRLPENIDSYIIYLLPGIIVQTVLFGSTQGVIAMNQDVNSGLIDRFRSLPMSRVAVVFARVLADSVRNAFVIALMVIVGIMLGFEFVNGVGNGMIALLIALLFSFTFSWISVCIGLFAKDAETAQSAGFIWVFPLAFASSIFVPVQTMPTWLQGFAENQPVSLASNVVRGFAVSGDTSDLVPLLVWLFGIMFFFMILAVRMYNRSSS